MNYLVLGSGRMSVGVVNDLLHFGNANRIDIADVSRESLDNLYNHFNDERVHRHQISASDKVNLIPLMEKADGVLSAVPYDYNFDLTSWAIESSCHFVDLGGNNTVVDKQFSLTKDASRAKVGVIPDCGLAPGMVSGVAAHLINQFDEVDTVEIRVGGLPVDPKPPLNYMLVFSVHGLINEYIEPTVILRAGKITTVDSMTETENLRFPEPFGTLEAFYTSGGTSTLPQTYEGKIQTLNYKTIRYPGHCRIIKAMMDLGFTSHDNVKLSDFSFQRREVFETLLIDPLTYESKDVVLIQILVKGNKNGQGLTKKYQAIEYGDNTGLTAMMRTTAFPAAIILEMLVDGRISDHGVLRQELSIPTDVFMKELEKRNIIFTEVFD